jgi:flagellar biosynthetic protein FliR
LDALTDLIPIAMRLPSLLMVVFRLAGIMVMAPLFGASAIPVRVRIALVIVIAMAAWPVLPMQALPQLSLPAIAIAVASEMLIGLTLGLGLTIIFSGLQLVGTMIGQQMGVSLADVFNPAFNDNADLLGVLFYWMGLMIFLAIGGHRMLMSGVLGSFNAVPLGGFSAGSEVLSMLTALMSASFAMAFKMALPAVLALFLTAIALGLINKTVPQLNILSAGFPLRALVGMLVMVATVTAMMRVFGGVLEDTLFSIGRVIDTWTASGG